MKEKKLRTTSTVEESFPRPLRAPFSGTGTPTAMSPDTTAAPASSSDQPTKIKFCLTTSGVTPVFKRSVAYTCGDDCSICYKYTIICEMRESNPRHLLC